VRSDEPEVPGLHTAFRSLAEHDGGGFPTSPEDRGQSRAKREIELVVRF
jgi:hypothetical protein